MALPHHLQAALSQVKSIRAEPQIAILGRHLNDVLALAQAGETLANTIRIIELQENPGAVAPDSMRRAFHRRYGSWEAFARGKHPASGVEERTIPTSRPEPMPSTPTTAEVAGEAPSFDFGTAGGIRDERGAGRVWGGGKQ